MTTYRFLQPLDVLFLRGNKLFGDPGSFGESLVPPWPSVAAGALRSQVLAADGVDLHAFAAGRVVHPTLGTPARPGPFTVTAFHLARRGDDDTIEALYVAPADLMLTRDDGDRLTVTRLIPRPLEPGLAASAALPQLAVLPERERRKPVGGFWLTQAGWERYLNGGTLGAGEFETSGRLWQFDARVGVGLHPEQHSADDGKLFSSQAVAPAPGVGFLVGVTGAEPPASGTLRLGGDGRGAAVQRVAFDPPQPGLAAIVAARRCRIVLTTPGIFPDGWRLPGVDAERRFNLHGVSGTLICAAVPRAETISGWDLAAWQPKAAQRAAPTGSVYWLTDLEASTEALRHLLRIGLWPASDGQHQRRAEGFNRFSFACY